MRNLVTGAAGFIGFHLAGRLLADGETVLGIDNLTPYYDPALKQARLARLRAHPGFRFIEGDIAVPDIVAALVRAHPDIARVYHLAAQAGVRYSVTHPYAYVHANLMGHVAMLEECRRLTRLEHFVYASSSSVYGGNAKVPFAEADRVDHPLSLYAATKRADELISHAFSHLHGIPQTGLRFFTVYGPWGRPDMAYFRFAEAIVSSQPLTLYDGGTLMRDFTYVEDVIERIIRAGALPPAPDAPRILNIGNDQAERVDRLVALLEAGLGKRAVIHHAPRPKADVPLTLADLTEADALTFPIPRTSLAEGIARFVAWFREWRGLG
jgi:UDP-glucuronate 4-epimerase